MDANEELRHLLAGTSASIRNAVGVSFTAAALLSDRLEGRDDPEAENYLAILRHSQHRMLRLAENIEDAIIAGSNVLEKETVDLNALCGNLVDTVSTLTAKRGIRITFNSLCRAVMQVDYARIERMLLNILSNSLKYTPEGGEIALTLSREGNTVILTVTDNGGGLAQADFDRLFTGYTRAAALDDPARGAGLGMAAALGIARLHGGNILAENHAGEGLVISVSLPDQGDADLLNIRYEPLKYGENPMRRVLTMLSDVLNTDEYHKRFMD